MNIEEAAEAKRARRAARKVTFIPVRASGHPGPAFARAAQRAQDRQERALAPNHDSAAMAKHRHRLDRRGKPRRPKASKPKPEFMPADIADDKRKRREWANARETERQRAEAERMAANAGLPKKHFYPQFGSLQRSI